MAETKGVLLPAYVLADESGSMAPYQSELGGGVASLCEGLHAEPMQRIPADVQWLRGDGYKVHRPVDFFLSDGQPTDGSAWRKPHAALTDRSRTPAAPNIIACGIDEVGQ